MNVKAPSHSALVRWGLLAVWFFVSFVGVFFARDLSIVVAGWPLGVWMSAQGALLMFLAIVVFFAWQQNRAELLKSSAAPAVLVHTSTALHKRFAWFIAAILGLMLCLAVAQSWGLPKAWVAGIFLSATVLVYAVIGVYGRTTDALEYYVAGRRIPALYNGMATAADWMSAASFISLAGTLYLQGFSGSSGQPGGLAYVMGWTGGFCLVALLVVPHLRRMEVITLPDFFARRFGGHWPRLIAAVAAILVSFTYVVAQIYGVGLILSRLIGVQFEIGILLGLGGVLVCSFLGGMRAVTWTQAIQYWVMILAFLIPVSWLSYQQTGNPLAPLAYGQQLEKIVALESTLVSSPTELEVAAEFLLRAEALDKKLLNVEQALQEERMRLRAKLNALGGSKVDDEASNKLRRELAALPRDARAAREHWAYLSQQYRERAQILGGVGSLTVAFSGDPDGTAKERQSFDDSRWNFLALVFCLMVGTAGMPHLLTRYCTTPSVAATRNSVAWSLFFIALLYISAPALAVFVKYEVMANLVGRHFDDLPLWMAQWAKDPSLLSYADINNDRILQFSEIHIGPDLLMLASPEIGGLPYIVSVLVAAGGLAAALSTADGLLLTIGNALAHDLYFNGDVSKVQSMRRVMWSKFALLVVALLAAYVAAHRPGGILLLVSASFSLAGAAFFPTMVLGIFWRKASHAGAVAGMSAGFVVTAYYMAINQPAVRKFFQLPGDGLWFQIAPVSAGLFGVLAGFISVVLVSFLRPDNPSHSAKGV